MRDEHDADINAVRTVHAAAFGRPAEGSLVDGLREGGFILSSLVAMLHERCVGNALPVGPLSVTYPAAFEAVD